MRYPASETAEKHERILDQAARLFRERGVSEVSVNDLMKAAELTHGSFYNHFQSKQHLVSECVDYVNVAALNRIMSNEPTKEGRGAFASRYLSVEARDNPGSYCLMSSLVSELTRDETARPAVTRYIGAFINKVANHFRWPRSSDPRKKAIRMTASLVGAMVLARAVDDDAFSKEILEEVIGQLSGDI
ncbi:MULTISPECIES: TetR/AcrR family transcriptional regulator [Rhizobium]|uniref:TetR/AcrR family transcriptional regulator n=1 Tax=Rhizobium TaxID=379 RepID=UPI000DDC43F4|nr:MULTISPECIES: TetR/AcrR family transcriptional regulator [Rhizobium]MBY3418335.1 TetR/AcrR family transcriptional regulator [Rhizobium laguerreae]NKJ38446.1 TetR/AcrR family transcriptional repressor of nem operon [Rhizobium sp. SG570]